MSGPADEDVLLSRADARRVAVRAQLLTRPRPRDLVEVVSHLGVVQADPAAAVAPSAEIVAWSRLGSAYRSGDLARATESGEVVEFRGMYRPAADMELLAPEMACWRGEGEEPSDEGRLAAQEWVAANDECRRDILAMLHDEGPLPVRALPDTTALPWRSSGWNDDRNVWDLAERVFPEVPLLPLATARRLRQERRLHALGIARASAAQAPGEPNDVGEVGVPAVVDGVRGRWRVDPAYLDGSFTGRTALLSPIDRLLIDRKRMSELFAFDYQLEMFKPAAKRRWGYWAMPVLHGDRLVGKLDAIADRERGVLVVNAVHEDEAWSVAQREAVHAQVHALADFLDLVPEGALG